MNWFDTAKPLIDRILRGVKNNIESKMCQPEWPRRLLFSGILLRVDISVANGQPLQKVPEELIAAFFVMFVPFVPEQGA